jgi:hypothetical protein
MSFSPFAREMLRQGSNRGYSEVIANVDEDAPGKQEKGGHNGQ